MGNKSAKNDIIIEHFDDIRRLYKLFESEKRIILYDIEAGDLQPIPYTDFKSILLSKKSQQLLEENYQRAQMNNKILVVVSDSKHQTIKTCFVTKASQNETDIPKLRTIFR